MMRERTLRQHECLAATNSRFAVLELQHKESKTNNNKNRDWGKVTKEAYERGADVGEAAEPVSATDEDCSTSATAAAASARTSPSSLIPST
jgi:hypothetical protein